MRRAVVGWVLLTALGGMAWAGPGVPDIEAIPHGRHAVLQWFETSWTTMARRMGDAFVVGYDAIWVPPPQRGGSPFSTGYDCYDRFDYGRATGERTRYGHLGPLTLMLRRAQRAGLTIYADTILNHNSFGTKFDTGFANNGGYPGFVFEAPGDPWGDFHAPGSSDELLMYVANLIDIAQEKNHRYIRQPVTPGDPRNIPGAGLPNKPITEANRRFYPDSNPAPGDVLTPSGFNLTNPLGGDPIEENATGLLLRYVRYMHEVLGITGFRIDATKHIPTWFFTEYYDPAVYQKGALDLLGNRVTPFSFNEALDTNYALLNGYRRMDGYGNRDNLDFPLFYALRDVFSANGLGNIGELRFRTYDSTDGNPLDGTAGVMMVSTHDEDNVGWSDTAHAYILTRAGMSVVYHNALEFGRSGSNPPFPREFGSRGDALGDYGDTLTRLVDVHRRFARGPMYDRWHDADYFIYERHGRLLVGINDRRLTGYIEQTVTTAFPGGTLLVELSGNAARYNSARGGAQIIPERITVPGNQLVTLRIPDDGGNDGYVCYAPATPGLLSLSLSNSTVITPDPLPPNPSLSDRARRRLSETWKVTSDSSVLRLQTDGGETGALVKINDGRDLNGNGRIDILRGGLAGFEFFPSQSVGAEGGTGTYTCTLDWRLLGDGYHYIEVVAFANAPTGLPLVWSSWRRVVFVDRQRPVVTVVAPAHLAAVPRGAVELWVTTDGTEDNVLANIDYRHVPNRPTGEFVQMDAVGPREWRIPLTVRDYDRYITVRAFEETGGYSDTVREIAGPGVPSHTPIPGRVRARPNPPQLGHPVLIEYDYLTGPLNTAQQIFLRRGYNYWTQTEPQDLLMQRNPDTGYYEAMFTVPLTAFVVDLRFGDGTGNWDNNNGSDWHLDVIDPPPGTPTATFTVRPTVTPTPTATRTTPPRLAVVPNPPQLGRPLLVSYSQAGGPLADATSVLVIKGENYWSQIDPPAMMTLNPSNGRHELSYNVGVTAFVVDLRFVDPRGYTDNNNGHDWHFEVVDPPPATRTPTPTPAAAVSVLGIF